MKTGQQPRHRVTPLFALGILLVGLSTTPADAQTTARWFDINPDRSNTDSENPNGASGGRINRLGAASDFSSVFAATEWGGLYQSRDQGATWVRVNSFSPSAAWDVKVDPRDSQRIYATSSYDGRNVNPQSGISFSEDGGQSWDPIDYPTWNTLTCTAGSRFQQPGAWQISINASDPDTVFIGTNCGLARTRDSGATWTFIDPSPGDSAEQVYAVVSHGDLVDVITDNGHFRNSNTGNGAWTATNTGPGPTAANSGSTSSLAISPAENFVLLAADTNNIFESQDGGATWPTSITLPLRNGNSNRQGRIPQIKTNQLSSSTQFDVWFGDVNVFRATATTPSPSSLGGPQRTPQNSWVNLQGEGHWDYGDVLFDPRAGSGACPELFANDGGVYVNTLQNNPSCQSPRWEQPTITPHATWIFGFDGRQNVPGVHNLSYGLQDNGGFAATLVLEGNNPPAPNWNNYTCCDVLSNMQGSAKLYSVQGSCGGCARAFRLFRRDTDGSDPVEIPNYPSPTLLTRFESGRQIARFGNNAYALNLNATQNDGVYFTNNITSNPIAWTALNSPTAATTGTGHIKIATFQTRPNVYYHTGNGNPESQGLIFRSSLVAPTGAAGSNWTQLQLPASVVTVTAWDVDPTNGNRVIISGINASNTLEIWMTQSFGPPWTRVNDLEDLMLGVPATGGTQTFRDPVSRGRNTGTLNFGTYWQPSLFQYNPLDSTTIVAGAVDAGVFLSLDDGDNWELLTDPLTPDSTTPHIPRPLFAYFSPSRFQASTTSFDVWIGSRGAGVWKAVLEPPSG